MRLAPTLALLGVVALLPEPAAAADRAAACQAQVARSGARFTRATLKIGQRCAMRAASAGLPGCALGADEGSGDRPTDQALAGAAARLAAKVGDACAGVDLSAFARRCPDPTGAPLSAGELVACLRNSHVERVRSMLAVEFPSRALAAAGTPDTCPAPQVCQCRCASPSGAFLSSTADAL